MGILGCNIQHNLLYYPSSGPPSEASLQAVGLKPWRSSQRDYRGFLPSREVAKPRGTVIVFHGNGGTAADRGFYGQALGAVGYRALLAEYPKYGGRKGALGESAFVEDAVTTVRLAHEEFGEPLFLLGESLGAGVAAAVAAKPPVHLAGIVLITPWDTLKSVATEKFPAIAVRLLLTDRYDSVANLKDFKGRIAVVGAEADEVIPIHHARRLYEMLPEGSKRLWVIQRVGHNNWPDRTSLTFWGEIMGFTDAPR